jgi:hypothetical protein
MKQGLVRIVSRKALRGYRKPGSAVCTLVRQPREKLASNARDARGRKTLREVDASGGVLLSAFAGQPAGVTAERSQGVGGLSETL